MTTRRNRPPSKQDRRPEGARPHKPSRPHKGRPETREPQPDERGRSDDRKPSGRKFSSVAKPKVQERTFSAPASSPGANRPSASLPNKVIRTQVRQITIFWTQFSERNSSEEP